MSTDSRVRSSRSLSLIAFALLSLTCSSFSSAVSARSSIAGEPPSTRHSFVWSTVRVTQRYTPVSPARPRRGRGFLPMRAATLGAHICGSFRAGVRYIRPMPLTVGTPAAPLGPRGLALMLGWRRVAFTLTLSTLIGLGLSIHWERGPLDGLIRAVPLGFMAMLTFGLFEQWPKRLPRRLARWVLQVLGVALIVPIVTTAIYVLSTPSGAPPFNQVPRRLAGYTALTVIGLLLAPWVALTALVRQK